MGGHLYGMANQRKAGKKKVSLWMTDEEKKELQKVAQLQGFPTLTDFLKHIAKKGSLLITLGFLALHVSRTPRRWNAAALKQTAAVAWVKVQQLKQHLAK